jgi:putative spermidine/putrescine transport system ATP-binding protein
MRSELKRLQRSLGITMLYVTHDQAEALALADRVIVMRAGCIEQMADAESIYARPRTGFVARFMGFENIFAVNDGALVGENGEMLAAGGAVPAGVAALGWRPDAVVIGHGDYTGRVLGASYLGAKMEYLIETPLGLVKAEIPAGERRYAAGDVVAFDLPVATAAPLESAA